MSKEFEQPKRKMAFISAEGIPTYAYPGDVELCEDLNSKPDRLNRGNKKNPDPIDTQVGGAHYRHFKIQPIEFITKNRMSFIEGNIIKYICRYKFKGEAEDLLKIKHYVDLLIKFKYGGK